MTSDFVFPDVSASDRGIVKAGYSQLFCSGLRTSVSSLMFSSNCVMILIFHKSQRLGQRIDGFLYKLRRRLDAVRRKWFC